ncbi:hypothetical protein OTSUT76_0726 [Orientia tsutsugamushi str. UT76]|nr:hypothetical protein OTSUT76_0726 [Orientia tsutsugamushi str. UT76]
MIGFGIKTTHSFINHHGEIVSFTLTPPNFDPRLAIFDIFFLYKYQTLVLPSFLLIQFQFVCNY